MSPRFSVLWPIEPCGYWCGTLQCFLSRSRFTPCVSMEGGLSVMGDCQCFYTGLMPESLLIPTTYYSQGNQKHFGSERGFLSKLTPVKFLSSRVSYLNPLRVLKILTNKYNSSSNAYSPQTQGHSQRGDGGLSLPVRISSPSSPLPGPHEMTLCTEVYEEPPF